MSFRAGPSVVEERGVELDSLVGLSIGLRLGGSLVVPCFLLRSPSRR
jgi:hypothetical protein